jgi:hypothetical protein
MKPTFVRIANKSVRLDAISYIEFLESGRAMIILSGLPPEKAHISVDVAETRGLREFFDQPEITANPNREPRGTLDFPRHRQFA